jgi:sigma-E factor negative regulatory protein RseC
MARVGTVLEVRGEHALIEAARRGVCEGCADQQSCAVDALGSSDHIESVLAHNPVAAGPGDVVEFDLAGHAELRISLLVWVVPLAGLIAGAIVGANLHGAISLGRDVGTLAGAVLGVALAFGAVVAVDRRSRGSPDLVPVVRKVLTPCGGSVATCIGEMSCDLRAAGD